MKRQHRIPVDHMVWTDEVTPEYQAEVDRYTYRLEREYNAALKRLNAAEDKAKRIEAESVSRATKKSHDRRQADAWAMVELRRLELQKYALMMACVPHASAQHRGPKSHRPIGMAS